MSNITLINVDEYETKFSDRFKRLSSGCSILDQLIFSGGFRVGTINEIVGAAGLGKTQLCLQLLATVQLPESQGGLNGKAIYLSTEDLFPSKRFNQIARSFGSKSFGDDVFVERIVEKDSFLNCISTILPMLLENRPNVRLLIIDSIAAPFRGEFQPSEIRDRAKSIQNLSMQLQRLSNKFNLVVICTNQVTDKMDGHEKNAYLGLSWANYVTNSFYLEKTASERSIRVNFSADNYSVDENTKSVKSINFLISNCDFDYIEHECVNAKELEHILMVLRSGEEGSFPELEKSAENKLRKLNPKSSLLSDNNGIKLQYRKFDQELEEWSKNLSNQIIDFDSKLTPIRAQNSELVFGQKQKRITSIKAEIKEHYEKWDKYDVDVELLKMDLKRERNLNRF